jgi:hypothetical protein
MNGHYSTDSRQLPKNRRVKIMIQMLKRPPNTMVLYHNWTRCICEWSNAEKPVRGVSSDLGAGVYISDPVLIASQGNQLK